MRAAFSVKLPRPLIACALAVGLAVVAAACGTGGYVKGGDVARGKQLFNTLLDVGHGQKNACSTCHTLAAAGAVGTIGPNLDNAFSADRRQGFKDSSIQQIVADQIRLPLQSVACPGPESQPPGLTPCSPGTAVNPTGGRVMPADLVRGKDLTDVSAFVATCAGNATDPACAAGK